ncbi:MAG: PBP1A family penicillin-binding protein [Candidatus Latescibacteria bacterium]|nr:PBP1A family penicillin-binding protein [Candidatus Latescibacterota bacterium]
MALFTYIGDRLRRAPWRRLGRYALVCGLFYTLGLVGVYILFSDNLPNLDELELVQPKRVTKVYSTDGKHLKDFLEENREILTYEEIPQAMQDALVAIEDRRFFSHWGVDIRRIFGAILANVRSASFTAEGASTLTQQLARNLFPKVGTQRSTASLEDIVGTYGRKIREQITAVHIERLYTKREILTMYLNTVLFGHGRYGLKAAARHYFSKDVSALQVEECALLAGLLKAPNNYSPLVSPERAVKRRNQVLHDMVGLGRLERSVYDSLAAQAVQVNRSQRAETYDAAPYFIEHVRLQLEERYGQGLRRDGLTVHTSLDARLQQIAEGHFDSEIGKVQESVDRYLGRRNRAEGLPDSATVQAAFVAMDPATGHVLAMIGGRQGSKFNRVTQALRLPGSSFKPFVYATAIDNGRFPTDLLEDNAYTVREYNGKIWDPENYDKTFKGPMTLREGLKQSRNLIAIKLAEEIGPRRIARYAQTIFPPRYYVEGLDPPQPGLSPFDPVTSIAVGTSAVRLMDLVAAYCVFPNRGIYVEPVTITQVLDKDGYPIFEEPHGEKREVLNPGTAVIVTDMMRSVIDEQGGTGNKIRWLYGFKTAAAGKTGTTNSYADAWFIGFTPHIVAGVWVGMDNPGLSLWPRQAGSVAALPLWALFMQSVYRDVPEYRRRGREDFVYPEELVIELPVCQDTYQLATKYCPNQQPDLFIKDGARPESCPKHGLRQGRSAGRTTRF